MLVTLVKTKEQPVRKSRRYPEESVRHYKQPIAALCGSIT
jgi:hypothetical protein